MYNDVIFISYHEPLANEHFKRLLDIIPHGGIGRVKNVDGILNAHIEAANKAGTEWFYVVDGDNYILDFDFDYEPSGSPDTTYVWRARNPYNNLEYGYGGVKLFHRRTLKERLRLFTMNTDMSTGLFKNFQPISYVASETRFAADEFHAWKGAFRECTKLASKSIARQKDDETDERLNIWLNHAEGEFAMYLLAGAKQGAKFGLTNKENADQLKLINNNSWLMNQFEKTYATS